MGKKYGDASQDDSRLTTQNQKNHRRHREKRFRIEFRVKWEFLLPQL